MASCTAAVQTCPMTPTSPAPTLSLMVSTYNAGDGLESTLRSCPGVEQIVIVDMGSTDATLDIAARAGAEVISVEHAGYVEPGRQHGLDAVVSDWVLVLDADERLIGGVAALREVLAAAPAEVAAFLLPRPTYLGDLQLLGTGWGAEYERQPRVLRRASDEIALVLW